MDQHFEPSPPGAPSPVFGYDLSNWIAWLMDAAGRGRVRGEDQLFSYKGNYREFELNDNANAGFNWMYLTPVPAGEVWVVTSVCAFDEDSSPSVIGIFTREAGVSVPLLRVVSPAADEPAAWNGHAYLGEGGQIQIAFEGCTAGDYLDVGAHGYKMTLEV